MKEYVGRRRPDGLAEVIIRENGKERRLPHVILHSPTGFEWGYGGQGPADLALSILVDHLGEAHKIPRQAFLTYDYRAEQAIERTRAWQLHRPFLWEVIAGLDRRGFVLPASAVEAWLRSQSEQLAAQGVPQ